MLKFFYLLILKNPLLWLVGYGILLRVILIFSYDGITIQPDSNNYVDLSLYLSNFDLGEYKGGRTPGYPMLIALAGGNLYVTVFMQHLIGLLNVMLIYDFCKLKTNSKVLSFWITAIITSFLPFLFFEFAILTETLTLFLLLLVFWFIEKFKILNRNTHVYYYLILSIILSCLYLTRPMFIYITIVIFVFYILKNFRFGFRRIIPNATVLVIIPFLSFYGWCSLNEKNIGYFTSSYYLGINQAQTATSFFDKAPEEDKLIRDIFVKHRDLNSERGSFKKHAMSVWFAWDELQEKTQLSPPDLSYELGRISKDLFRKYPNLYFKQVFISWKDFWRHSLVIKYDMIKYKFVQDWTIRFWVYFQRYLVVIFNILFILFSIRKIYQFIQSKFKKYDSDLLLVGVVILGSIAQALVAYGSNSRFCFPYFPLIFYFVLINLYSFKKLNLIKL